MEPSEVPATTSSTDSLRPFFQPRAVAVVGASRDQASISARTLAALLRSRFPGPVYPVNPRAAEVEGLPAYPSVRAIPGVVDLAIIVAPRDSVLGIVDDCAVHGVKALVVITAGFAETGVEGRALEASLVEKVRAAGMRMVGPNCLGLLSTSAASPINASFSPIFPRSGRVAISSESGAIALAVLQAAQGAGLGISSCVSVGNRADVSSNDLLDYWGNDDGTDVILLYLESFGNPRNFARIAREVARRKPVVAVKAGRTRAGRRAAGSHTAALAASDVAVEALFHQTGVIRAGTLEELIDLAAALSSQPLPAGRRVAVLTNAGGPGILCADACEAGGLVLPELSEETRSQLAAFLPRAAALTNPIDMIASAGAEQFRRAAGVLLASGEVDALIVVYVSAGADAPSAVLQGVDEAVMSLGSPPVIPVLASVMEERPPAEPGKIACAEAGIPCYEFPEEPARALSKMAAYAEWRAQPPGELRRFGDADLATARDVCRRALADRGPGWLTVEETRTVLRAMRLPVAPGGVARTADEAATLAGEVGFPVAVKLASHEIVHKTEIGGVHVELSDEAAVRSAFQQIHDRLAKDGRLEAMEGVLVQPMVAGGTEVLVGMTQDPMFGPLVAFGLGGIHVEVLRDVCLRVTPLSDRDAAEMVRSIRGYPLLEGYRGHPKGDVPALEELLQRVGRIEEDLPEISEMDLNPVFVLQPGEGCRIVDARIRLGSAAR